MGKLEAVYQGVLTQTGYISDEQRIAEQKKYEYVTEVAAIAIARDRRPLLEGDETRNRKPKTREIDLWGKLILKLPLGHRKPAITDDQIDRLIYSNPARAAFHPLFDALSDVAEAAESSRASFAPDDLVETCLEGNYAHDFVADSGIEEEHLPRVLQVTARALAATAFQLPRRREVVDTAVLSPPYDYKSFEIYSVPGK